MTSTLPVSESTPTTTPRDVLAIAVPDRLRGQEMLLAMSRLGKRQSVALSDAAIVELNRKGKPHIIQTRELSPAQGAMLGAWWGSLLGIFIYGTLGWVAGALLGGAIGWWRARRRDVGVPDDWMRHLVGRIYQPEVAAVFEMRNVYAIHLLRELRRFEGRLLASTIDDVDRDEIEEALNYVI